MAEHPDLVEDFFRMMQEHLLHCPGLLVQADMLNGVIQFGLFGMGLQHRESFERVLTTLRLFIVNARPDPAGVAAHLTEDDQASLARGGRGQGLMKSAAELAAFQQAVATHGPAIMNRCLAGVAGGVPSERTRIIHELMEAVRALPLGDAYPQWLHAALAAVPTAEDAARRELFEALTTTAPERDRFRVREDALEDFRYHCANRARRLAP